MGRALGVIALLIFLGMMFVGAWPFVSCAHDYWRRSAAQPNLLPLSEGWSDRFLWIDDYVTVDVGQLPSDWPSAAGRDAGLFDIVPREPFRGFGVKEPYPDWSNYEYFAFDVDNPTTAPLKCGIRIHDFQHNEQFHDRYNRELVIQPGFQTIRITTDEIAKGPRGRRINLKHIEGVKVFLVGQIASLQLYAGNFRLE